MNGSPYPRGAARSIAEARSSGMRPAGIVLIVLAGKFEWENPTVYATPGQRYRWDWLRGLQAVVLIDAKTRLDGILSDIESAEPKQLDVIDHERKQGWLVNFTKPKLKTVRWPRAWVLDWLSENQEWHRGLNAYKAQFAVTAAAHRTETAFVEPKGFWPWN